MLGTVNGFLSRRHRVKISAQDPGIVTEVFHGFPRFLKANDEASLMKSILFIYRGFDT
jgi:hypothetical protein